RDGDRAHGSEVGEAVEGAFDLGKSHLVSACHGDVPGTADELELPIDQATLIVDGGPSVGTDEHLVGRAREVPVGAGRGADPEGAEVAGRDLGPGIVADRRADPVVDADEGPVARTAVTDEPDLRGTVVAD